MLSLILGKGKLEDMRKERKRSEVYIGLPPMLIVPTKSTNFLDFGKFLAE